MDALARSAPPHLLALALLDEHDLVGVTHTLALVRLRLTLGANNGGEVADLHLVVPGHDDIRVAGALHLEPLGDVEDHRVRVAESQVEGRALHRRLVADADELQLLLEPGRNTHHHVVREGPVQTVTLTSLPGLVSLFQLDRTLNLFSEKRGGAGQALREGKRDVVDQKDARASTCEGKTTLEDVPPS